MLPNPRGPILHNNRSLLFASIIKKIRDNDAECMTRQVDTNIIFQLHTPRDSTEKSQPRFVAFFLKNWDGEKKQSQCDLKVEFPPIQKSTQCPIVFERKSP